MFNSLQKQISEINNQLTFLLTALSKLTSDVNKDRDNLMTINENISDIVASIIQITNDSETIQINKESYYNEKNN
jgi:uncharacterized protein YoxC